MKKRRGGSSNKIIASRYLKTSRPSFFLYVKRAIERNKVLTKIPNLLYDKFLYFTELNIRYTLPNREAKLLTCT